MNVIIIEDEAPSARRLHRMLKDLGVEVDKILHSVEEAVSWFSSNTHPDLIFLDIQLSDGLSFEIFDSIDIKSAIIFTTAYDEYALQAFKLNSIDYLLKPIDEDELVKAVEKYKNFQPTKNPIHIDFNDIKKLLVNPIERTYRKRFTVKVGQHIKLISLEDIVCFYSENKGTYLHANENRSYLMDTTLEALQEELPPEEFFRVSRKFCININAVKDIINYTNARLQVKINNFNEQEIIVSRERVKDFKDWLS